MTPWIFSEFYLLPVYSCRHNYTDTQTSYRHIPVRRDIDLADHTALHQRRVEQHEEQLRNYARNVADVDLLAKHEEVLVTAARMGSKERDLKKRAPEDPHSQPMANCKYHLWDCKLASHDECNLC